jgi:hypothetical protein
VSGAEARHSLCAADNSADIFRRIFQRRRNLLFVRWISTGGIPAVASVSARGVGRSSRRQRAAPFRCHFPRETLPVSVQRVHRAGAVV